MRRPITNPENFLKSSSELNLVLRSITRSQVFLCAGPAWITASISLHTEVFMRPNEVITSSCNHQHSEQSFHIIQITPDGLISLILHDIELSSSILTLLYARDFYILELYIYIEIFRESEDIFDIRKD